MKLNKKSIFVTVSLVVVLAMSLGGQGVRAATPEEIELAIEAGLEWLAEQQDYDGYWGTSYLVGHTGLAVLKFETHAVGLGLDPLDPSY